MNLLVLCFTSLSLMTSYQGFNDRRIIIITAMEYSSGVENQLNSLQNYTLELEERRLAVFTLIDGNLNPVINSSQRSLDFVEKNKTNFASTSKLTIYLVGLDKHIKHRFSDGVSPQQIFDSVDSMPMRRAELKNK